ncbi:MAG TPA: glutamate--tRNA ligase, partial [Bacteroidales bacterium]|nr:glutamate--tRNA ligase [Bacteroidales bacterium]
NHQYLIRKSNEEIAGHFGKILSKKGFNIDLEKITRVVSLVKERVNFVNELWAESYFFFEAPQTYDDQVIKKRWKDDSPAQMKSLATMLSSLENFDTTAIDEAVKAWLETNGYGMGAVMNALRLLLVGASKGPHLADIMAVIGKEESIRRIAAGIEKIKI